MWATDWTSADGIEEGPRESLAEEHYNCITTALKGFSPVYNYCDVQYCFALSITDKNSLKVTGVKEDFNLVQFTR